MRFLSKIIVILLSVFSLVIIFGFIFNFSVVFPFTISNDIHDVPEHSLQSVRLATAATFAYFGLRYIFFQTTKLYPIQFMGIFLFFFRITGRHCCIQVSSSYIRIFCINLLFTCFNCFISGWKT